MKITGKLLLLRYVLLVTMCGRGVDDSQARPKGFQDVLQRMMLMRGRY